MPNGFLHWVYSMIRHSAICLDFWGSNRITINSSCSFRVHFGLSTVGDECTWRRQCTPCTIQSLSSYITRSHTQQQQQQQTVKSIFIQILTKPRLVFFSSPSFCSVFSLYLSYQFHCDLRRWTNIIASNNNKWKTKIFFCRSKQTTEENKKKNL